MALGSTQPVAEECQEYILRVKEDRCVGLETVIPLCADCFEIWESQRPGTVWACNRSAQGLLYLYP
jgi:hypothetical protein